MEIRDNIPPHNPIICLFVSFSLKIITDITELKIIALPFTTGKKIWLGKSPESLRFKKFIKNVQTPQIGANIKSFLFKNIPSYTEMGRIK